MGSLMTTTDLEVAWDKARKAWVLRHWAGSKVFAVYPTKTRAVDIAAALGPIIAEHWNNGACELYIRTKDGRIQDRRTYGHDPERSVG